MALDSIVNWSGGKDSCLALFKALQRGHRAKILGTSLSFETGRVAFQDIPLSVVRLQAKALNIPLKYDYLSESGDPESYADKSYLKLRQLRDNDGIRAIISGHINTKDLQARQLKRSAARLGMEIIAPLAGKSRKEVLNQFLDNGFQAVIAKVDGTLLDPHWLGRPVDREFIAYLERHGSIDLCGDNGEYHSLVVDGPLFSRRLSLGKIRPIKTGRYFILDELKCAAEGKQ